MQTKNATNNAINDTLYICTSCDGRKKYLSAPAVIKDLVRTASDDYLMTVVHWIINEGALLEVSNGNDVETWTTELKK